MRKKSARPMRKKRQLPGALHPLAELVELANLIEEEQTNRLHSANQRLDEACGEMVARNAGAVGGTDQTLASFREQAHTASAEMKKIFADFSARVLEHATAISGLLRLMRLSDYVRPDDGSLPTLFDTIVAVRSSLRTVATNLTLRDDIVRLPEACYRPQAILRRVDGRIRVTVAPVIHWLLPLLDGLDAGRLGICDACGKLYVGLRRDQLGCSGKCGDTLYMRRYRNPNYRNRNKPHSKRRQIREALNTLTRKSGMNP